jgi:hypothetical protein
MKKGQHPESVNSELLASVLCGAIHGEVAIAVTGRPAGSIPTSSNHLLNAQPVAGNCESGFASGLRPKAGFAPAVILAASQKKARLK